MFMNRLLARVLSHDLPRNRWLAILLVVLLLGLATAPWWLTGSKALAVAAKMLVFIVLVASYDLLLGYTGIVSFAHTMFFGIGAYGVAIASTRMGPGWAAVAVGLGVALALSLALSLLIGLFSLRVKAILPVALYPQLKPGQKAEVVPEKPFSGRLSTAVTVVDQVIDAASGTFQARMEIANPTGALPGGIKCKVSFTGR